MNNNEDRVYNTPDFENADSNSKKMKKSTIWAIIAIVAVIAFLAGGLISYYAFGTPEKKLRRKLSGMVEKPIIEFCYDDFNSDGIGEAFAVVGDGTDESFKNADIWFVSDEVEEKLKENTEGFVNGVIRDGDRKYLSVEIKDAETSHSYIYGVEEENKSFEPEISGKYSGVHQDGNKILTADDTEIHMNEAEPVQKTAAVKTYKESKSESTVQAKKASPEKKNSPAELLELYYKNNYNSKYSGKYINDFDGDGTEEMVVAESKISKYITLTECDLYLVTVKNGKAQVSDKYEVSNAVFERMFIDINEENKDGWLEHYRQYTEAFVTSKGYISLNITNALQGCATDYFLLEIRNDKISLKQHLLDPGYTDGSEGLYYYDGYYSRFEDSMVYEKDVMGQKYGKYQSCIEALNGTVGVGGITFEQKENSGLYIVKPTNSCIKLYSFDTFPKNSDSSEREVR